LAASAIVVARLIENIPQDGPACYRRDGSFDPRPIAHFKLGESLPQNVMGLSKSSINFTQ
jgi:hypothetical protein